MTKPKPYDDHSDRNSRAAQLNSKADQPPRKVWTSVGAVTVPGPAADIIDELLSAVEATLKDAAASSFSGCLEITASTHQQLAIASTNAQPPDSCGLSGTGKTSSYRSCKDPLIDDFT